MNILLVIGIIILVGAVGGRICHKLNMPSITGYIIIGLVLGQSFSNFLSDKIIASFVPIIDLALGVIGFMIGAEIRFERFKKYSRSIYTILFAEAFLTFFLVAIVSFLLTGKLYLGIILGAIASATAPAATYSVLGEYKARGPLTTTTLSIVALDDAVALIIFGFASVFARSLIVHQRLSIINAVAVPLGSISLSVAIGATAGWVLHKIVVRIRERERIFPITLGTIIFVVGLTMHFKMDPILASMVLGAMAANLQKTESSEMSDMITRLSSPIFILFFVLVGARLDARILFKSGVFILAVSYIAARSVGKIAGSYLGGKLSNARETVSKYLGFCLFDQAGVAVGLAIAAFASFSALGGEAELAGLVIINVVTATTFILQLIAPPMIRLGIKKADEINRNVTEEDIIEKYRIGDVMEEDFFIIRENNNLHQIMNIMKKSDAYNFPVVDLNGDFLGVISLGDIRDTFYEEQMDQLILAGDMVREIDIIVYAGEPLEKAIDIFQKKNIEYLPVLKEGAKKVAGQLDYHRLMDRIRREVLARQQELESA